MTNAEVFSLWRGKIKLRPVGPTMAEIASSVAEEFGVALSELFGPDRTRRVSLPRQEAMARMRQAGRSTTQIGKFFGRDHSTVVHACRSVERRHGRPV